MGFGSMFQTNENPMPSYFTSEAHREAYMASLDNSIKSTAAGGAAGAGSEAKFIKGVVIPIMQKKVAATKQTAPQGTSAPAPVQEQNAEEWSDASKKRQIIKANRSVKT